MTAPLASTTLSARIDAVLAEAFATAGLPVEGARAARASRPELADLQCNGALPLAKSQGQNPREIATAIAAALAGHPALDSVEVAGPGFINLRLSARFLADCATAQGSDPMMGLREVPRRMVIDFGGPNVAKPLHVGHLRSLVIGESLRRILAGLGHHVVSDVHLGDWGLQMGMLVAEIRRRWPELSCFATPPRPPASLPFDMADLTLLYPAAAAACREDPDRMAEARADTAALQSGEPGHRMLWSAMRALSLAAQTRDFATIGAHFDLLLGESDVQPLIPGMIEDLVERGIAIPSDGALIVEVAAETDARPMPPLLLAKSDGAALYATTDLATILERVQRFPDLAAIVYVVDQRQSLHFEQVFRAAARAGYAPGVTLTFAGFGTVNGPDGKPYKTRQGGVAQLADLLDEAIGKAAERLAPRADLDDDARARLARTIGIAAVKFADLSSYRTSGYVFDPERLVSFEGRTGPYVQYACVRIASILERAAAEGHAPGAIAVIEPAERALVLDAARLPDIVASAAANLAPNELADFVFGLAQSFSRFYADCPVLAAPDPDIRASRLALCALTRAVLVHGLDLLGIAVPDRM
ncbi:arginyl-tRNA synthetase [Endobacter medicaginis]|uniref:Arginine--tRNA ligase n=3 Tax=Endobacter medicaginis TaxID=1181271 RepID=A0A839UWU6_9PROT|nr:arginine--tRNA ligase [Endobacter medicaginis]MBB3173135.1 arginyl-tRNA synthetase [Endobacter medicaginis]MCX5476965.1 arginine--tRNA ligase [Endobacter medicaginis]